MTTIELSPVAFLKADILRTGLTVPKSAYAQLGYYNMLTPDGYNPKTKKGRARGYSTAIQHFAPANLSGYEVCRGRSFGCTAACLNTAGQGGIALDVNGLNNVQRARIARTLTFFQNQFLYFAVLVREVATHVRRSAKNGMTPAVRPNGTSDLDFERIRMASGLTLMETFPDVQFYDYTKIFSRALANARGEHPSNYFLCFSRSETNEEQCRQILNAGGNVAVVIKVCDCKGPCHHTLPEGLTYLGRPIINGDLDDLRFLDPRGVIVGLKAKGRAKLDTTGFVVDVADCGRGGYGRSYLSAALSRAA